MNRRNIATVFFYFLAIIVAYLIFLTCFTTQNLNLNLNLNPMSSVATPTDSAEPKILEVAPQVIIPITSTISEVIQNSSAPIIGIEKIIFRENTVFPNLTTQLSPNQSSCSDPETNGRGFIMKPLSKSFFWCAYPMWSRFQGLPEQMAANWAYSFYVCDYDDLMKDIPVNPYPTLEKIYWGVPPQCREEHVLVTIGVKNDSLAIRKMKENWGELVSYGTSTTDYRNTVYQHFYNYEIGGNGTGKLKIYDSEKNTMKSYDKSVQSFFKDIVKVKTIDMFWFNLEGGGQFEYWRYFGKNGVLAGLGITVCQMNLEFYKDDAVNFEKFMNEFFSSRTYMFMRPMITQDERIIRAFFLNIQDEICIRKYLK